MTDPHYILTLTILLGALGFWLMLPRGTAHGRSAGIVMAAVALGLGVSQVPRLGDWIQDGVFLILAAVTVVSAAAAVTFRNPLYCAIWFGLSVLGVSGLFFFTDAQFLAVATVIVYAGAILVTFLFVLMLAQPDGKAPYDRVSWESLISSATGMVIVGVLSMTIGAVFSPRPLGEGPGARADCVDNGLQPYSAAELTEGILAPQHVARLGEELFGRHLIAVEAAGMLLFVSLVGAASIVAHQKKD